MSCHGHMITEHTSWYVMIIETYSIHVLFIELCVR